MLKEKDSVLIYEKILLNEVETKDCILNYDLIKCGDDPLFIPHDLNESIWILTQDNQLSMYSKYSSKKVLVFSLNPADLKVKETINLFEFLRDKEQKKLSNIRNEDSEELKN